MGKHPKHIKSRTGESHPLTLTLHELRDAVSADKKPPSVRCMAQIPTGIFLCLFFFFFRPSDLFPVARGCVYRHIPFSSSHPRTVRWFGGTTGYLLCGVASSAPPGTSRPGRALLARGMVGVYAGHDFVSGGWQALLSGYAAMDSWRFRYGFLCPESVDGHARCQSRP
ncbi:hypothetical protein LZ32DRAFT_195790 [Colletotrichum eremochloae]|nr:hypothetical protein LZ32DRAFT_195790 [Colletotrichum eremochloae]